MADEEYNGHNCCDNGPAEEHECPLIEIDDTKDVCDCCEECTLQCELEI